MTKKRFFPALVLALSLTVPAWAGVTDVTDGTTANTYTHTYHTKVDAKATFHLKNGSTYEISHDSGFVVGNLSDDAVQSQIKVFYDRVAAYLAEDGIGLSKISCTEKMVFDHFESSNIIGPSILVGDSGALEEATSGFVNKNLDVHEYQVYTIKAEYGTPTARRHYSSSGGISITPLLTAPDALSPTDYSGGIYGLTFRASTGYGSFKGVKVNGKTISAGNYIAEENGGTEIYLKAAYLQTLAPGKYTMTVMTESGEVTTEFTVGGVMTAPKTADAGALVYLAMALSSYTGTALVARKRRKEF